MSEEKSPRWKSEVAPRESESPETIRIDIGEGADVKVGAVIVETSASETRTTEPGDAGARRPAAHRKSVQKKAIIVGIAGGAVLGAILAYGILSFVWWRREVNADAQFAAEVKAIQEAEAKKKQAEFDDAMRQFSIKHGTR